MADFSKPVTTDTYTNVLTYLKATTSDLALGLDPATTTPTNVPTNAVRWNSASNKWQKYNGTAWADLSTLYAINIGGNAATATTATSATSATSATTSTNLAAGGAGTIPYQSAAATTAMLAAGTSGQVLQSNGASAPSWVAQSTLTAGNATAAVTATNLAAGSAGTIPYQTAAGTTAMLAAGTSGYVLKSNGTSAPTWVASTTLDAGTVDGKNLGTFSAAGGVAYASDTTTLSATAAGTSGQALLSGGASAPTWGTLGIPAGGTGGTTASAALVNLGVWTSATGAYKISAGTTAQRDASPTAGYLRFNTDLTKFEGWNGSAWSAVGGGATGGGSDAVFVENGQAVTTNYTLGTGKNAMSAGPVTINSGVVVTVPSGAVWVIV